MHTRSTTQRVSEGFLAHCSYWGICETWGPFFIIRRLAVGYPNVDDTSVTSA